MGVNSLGDNKGGDEREAWLTRGTVGVIQGLLGRLQPLGRVVQAHFFEMPLLKPNFEWKEIPPSFP